MYGKEAEVSAVSRKVTVPELAAMKRRGERIAMLTSYDASFGRVVDRSGVDVILVGDSLGMVIKGDSDTLGVTIDDVIYHSAAVSRSLERALLVADFPFLTDRDVPHAIDAAGKLMSKGKASMVKVEGAGHILEVIAALVARDMPVCGHLGLTPQSVHKLGGYRVQGKAMGEAERLRKEAVDVEAAGADLLVLECVPSDLGAAIAQSLTIPVIGIGAGPGCDGQVLVLHDLLGVTSGIRPRFCKDFLGEGGSVSGAIRQYVDDVKNGSFPSMGHSYK